MLITDGSPLLVGLLLVLFVMAMVGVDEISQLPDLMLEMNCFDFGVVQLGICILGQPGSKAGGVSCPSAFGGVHSSSACA